MKLYILHAAFRAEDQKDDQEDEVVQEARGCSQVLETRR